MSGGSVRRVLHLGHLLATLVLLASGLLLNLPDLRAELVGGYGREIARIHMWAGWVFLAVPALALGAAARSLWGELLRRLGPPDPWTWRKLHTVTTLVAANLLATSGLILWVDLTLPDWLLDGALEVHIVLHWVVTATIPIHLFAARHKIVARTRELVGLDAGPDLGFPFEDED